jgi:hypothetical protein
LLGFVPIGGSQAGAFAGQGVYTVELIPPATPAA